MSDSVAERSGPLHYRRGPSCFWIVTLPLFLSFCSVLYGGALYCLIARQYGWLCLIAVVPISYYVFKWSKAFRFWSTTFDRTRELVTTRKGLFFPIWVREYHYAELEALQIGRQLVHVYRDRYFIHHPVSVQLADGNRTTLLHYEDFFQARQMAEEAAIYAALPLIDASVEPAQFIPAAKVGKPLRTAVPWQQAKSEIAPAPPGSRCRMVWENKAAVVRLPLSGLARTGADLIKFLAYVVVVGGFPIVLLGLLSGEWQKWATLGLYGAGFCVAPVLLLSLFGVVFFGLRTATLRLDQEGLHYRTRALLARSTRDIPHSALKGIRLDGQVIEILTPSERIRFGEQLTTAEREWLCEALNQLAAG